MLAFVLLLAGCGGGASGGDDVAADSVTDSGASTEGWRGPVADIFTLAPEPGTVSSLMPAQLPSNAVGLSGAFGTRLGGTDQAVYGAAHMRADFEAGRVEGWIDQAGLYAVGTGVPLAIADPQKREDLAGRLVFDGRIEQNPAPGEGVWFDSALTGSLTGTNTQISITGNVDRGAFMVGPDGIMAIGSVNGTATIYGISGVNIEILREAGILVLQ